MLDVNWDPRVPVGLRLLPEADRRRVVRVILSLADEPLPQGARALPRGAGWYGLHEGRFQIVYILDATSLTIAVYAVLEDGELLNSEEYRIDA